MCRLQKLLVALTDIIVIYHAKQLNTKDEMRICDRVIDTEGSSEGDQDDSMVEIVVQHNDQKEDDLQALILDITKNDTKRYSLLIYLLNMIRLLRPLVMSPARLEKEHLTDIQGRIVQLIVTLKNLLKTQSPNSIIVNDGSNNVMICGFINELKDGGGICTSGSIIIDILLSTLFPCILSPMNATDEYIRQTVSDILRDQQFAFIEQENTYLRLANDVLQTKNRQLQEAKEYKSAPSVGGLFPRFSKFGTGIGLLSSPPIKVELAQKDDTEELDEFTCVGSHAT